MANDVPQPLELVVDRGLDTVVVDFRSFFAEHHRRIAAALAMTLRDDVLAADATAEAIPPTRRCRRPSSSPSSTPRWLRSRSINGAWWCFATCSTGPSSKPPRRSTSRPAP